MERRISYLYQGQVSHNSPSLCTFTSLNGYPDVALLCKCALIGSSKDAR